MEVFDLESYIIVHVKFKGPLDLAGLTHLVFNIQKLLIKVQTLTQKLIIYKTFFLKQSAADYTEFDSQTNIWTS